MDARRKADEFVARAKDGQLGKSTTDDFFTALNAQSNAVRMTALYCIVETALVFGGMSDEDILAKYGPPPK